MQPYLVWVWLFMCMFRCVCVCCLSLFVYVYVCVSVRQTWGARGNCGAALLPALRSMKISLATTLV